MDQLAEVGTTQGVLIVSVSGAHVVVAKHTNPSAGEVLNATQARELSNALTAGADVLEGVTR